MTMDGVRRQGEEIVQALFSGSTMRIKGKTVLVTESARRVLLERQIRARARRRQRENERELVR